MQNIAIFAISFNLQQLQSRAYLKLVAIFDSLKQHFILRKCCSWLLVEFCFVLGMVDGRGGVALFYVGFDKVHTLCLKDSVDLHIGFDYTVGNCFVTRRNEYCGTLSFSSG